MQIHQLETPKGSRKRKRIVGRGRGSGCGKTCGRGMNGQKSRSGRGILGALEGGQMPLIRRLPKVGFRSKRPLVYQLIKLEQLSRFKSGDIVDAKILEEKGLIRSIYKPFKILGNGNIENALTVQAYSFSKSAADKIVKAGGKVERIDKAKLKENKE